MLWGERKMQRKTPFPSRRGNGNVFRVSGNGQEQETRASEGGGTMARDECMQMIAGAGLRAAGMVCQRQFIPQRGDSLLKVISAVEKHNGCCLCGGAGREKRCPPPVLESLCRLPLPGRRSLASNRFTSSWLAAAWEGGWVDYSSESPSLPPPPPAGMGHSLSSWSPPAVLPFQAAVLGWNSLFSLFLEHVPERGTWRAEHEQRE